MNKFQVAHFQEQGQQIIVVFVRHQITGAQTLALQVCANEAGLAGTVVPVWSNGNGFGYRAPSQWHSFFSSVSWNDLVATINHELTCG